MKWILRWVVVLSVLGFGSTSLRGDQPMMGTDGNGMAIIESGPSHGSSHGCRERGVCGLEAGASIYILRPNFADNTAFTTRTGAGANISEKVTDFNWNLQPGFAGWLEWTFGNGLGMRGRGFYFNQNSTTSTTQLSAADAAAGTVINPPTSLATIAGVTPNFRSPGTLLTAGLGTDVLNFDSSLRIITADLEITRELRRNRWYLMLSGGGRFANMAQSYSGVLTNDAAGVPSETQRLLFTHSFNGGGPTVALEGNYNICGCFSIFGMARGSLLVGSGKQNTSFNQVVNDPGAVAGGSVNITRTSSGSKTTVMPTAEIELGLEYARDFGNIQPFIRTTVVNQTYFNAGSASQTDGILNLFGTQVTLGFRF